MIEAIRFRAAEAGVILQVQARERSEYDSYRQSAPKWRDATVEDLLDVAKFTRQAEDDRISGLQQMVNELYRRAMQEQPT